MKKYKKYERGVKCPNCKEPWFRVVYKNSPNALRSINLECRNCDRVLTIFQPNIEVIGVVDE